MEFHCPDILAGHPNSRLNEAAPLPDVKAELERAQAMLTSVREYGRTLWSQLDDVRRYLLDEVAGSEDGAQPAMLADRAEWRAWVELFAGVSSALAGTTGDTGLGRSEATLVARAHGVELSAWRR